MEKATVCARRFRPGHLAAVAVLVLAAGKADAQTRSAQKPAPKPAPRTAPKTPPRSTRKPPAARPANPGKTAPKAKPPAKAAPASPASVTTANLPAVLKSLGYPSKAVGPYQRIEVVEEKYGYLIDMSFTRTGEWLVCMAHLAPIADLTRVRSASLLNLLSQNDSLLGMYFSYNRENAQLMLNASLPSRGLTPTDLHRMIEGLKLTVRRTEGLWDLGNP